MWGLGVNELHCFSAHWGHEGGLRECLLRSLGNEFNELFGRIERERVSVGIFIACGVGG